MYEYEGKGPDVICLTLLPTISKVLCDRVTNASSSKPGTPRILKQNVTVSYSIHCELAHFLEVSKNRKCHVVLTKNEVKP